MLTCKNNLPIFTIVLKSNMKIGAIKEITILFTTNFMNVPCDNQNTLRILILALLNMFTHQHCYREIGVPLSDCLFVSLSNSFSLKLHHGL